MCRYIPSKRYLVEPAARLEPVRKGILLEKLSNDEASVGKSTVIAPISTPKSTRAFASGLLEAHISLRPRSHPFQVRFICIAKDALDSMMFLFLVQVHLPPSRESNLNCGLFRSLMCLIPTTSIPTGPIAPGSDRSLCGMWYEAVSGGLFPWFKITICVD